MTCSPKPIFLALLTQREPGLCCLSAGLLRESSPSIESEDPSALLRRQGLSALLETEG